MFRRVTSVLLAVMIAATSGMSILVAQEESIGFDVGFEPVAEGFDQPTGIETAGDGSGTNYVVEKPGTIRTIMDSERVETPFLDITDRVGSDGYEQGLLGLAFPPDYAESQVFYVNYTDTSGNTVVSRFAVGDNGIADSASEEIILQQAQPYENHNGGQVAFGPDGYLYIGFGDGGSQGDPENRAQNLETWLGKILRIDVDPSVASEHHPYAIPEDNPFVGSEDALPEIYAYGLRNPWRFSFDAETGEMFIADVGQNEMEEINILPVNPDEALNFGWNTMEGTNCYLTDPCEEDGLTMPVMEYSHDVGGCSVTGGEVYYGENLTSYVGTYIFADYCSGLVWQGTRASDGTWTMSDPVESGLAISSFGVDEQGEILIADLEGGTVYRLEAPL